MVVENGVRQGVRKVTITKGSPSESWGLTICGGADFPHKEEDHGIFVSEVSRDDVDLHVGDRILEANSIALSGVSHHEAVEALTLNPKILDLLIEPAQQSFHSPDSCGEPIVSDPVTEVDFGTREDEILSPVYILTKEHDTNKLYSTAPSPAPIEETFAEKLAARSKSRPAAAEEQLSSLPAIVGAMAVVAAGAALVAFILRK